MPWKKEGIATWNGLLFPPAPWARWNALKKRRDCDDNKEMKISELYNNVEMPWKKEGIATNLNIICNACLLGCWNALKKRRDCDISEIFRLFDRHLERLKCPEKKKGLRHGGESPYTLADRTGLKCPEKKKGLRPPEGWCQAGHGNRRWNALNKRRDCDIQVRPFTPIGTRQVEMPWIKEGIATCYHGEGLVYYSLLKCPE